MPYTKQRFRYLSMQIIANYCEIVGELVMTENETVNRYTTVRLSLTFRWYQLIYTNGTFVYTDTITTGVSSLCMYREGQFTNRRARHKTRQMQSIESVTQRFAAQKIAKLRKIIHLTADAVQIYQSTLSCWNCKICHICKIFEHQLQTAHDCVSIAAG